MVKERASVRRVAQGPSQILLEYCRDSFRDCLGNRTIGRRSREELEVRRVVEERDPVDGTLGVTDHRIKLRIPFQRSNEFWENI
jgi:hypothetical protein